MNVRLEEHRIVDSTRGKKITSYLGEENSKTIGGVHLPYSHRRLFVLLRSPRRHKAFAPMKRTRRLDAGVSDCRQKDKEILTRAWTRSPSVPLDQSRADGVEKDIPPCLRICLTIGGVPSAI